MYLLQLVITEAAEFVMRQPLPPIPQQNNPDWIQFALNALFAILWSLVAALIFTIVIVVGMRVYHALTPGVNELQELEQGNTAVGLTMAAFMIAITAVVIAVLLK